jgi:hypothetical protein
MRKAAAVRQLGNDFGFFDPQIPLDPTPSFGFDAPGSPLYGQTSEIELGNTGIMITIGEGVCTELPAWVLPAAPFLVQAANQQLIESEAPFRLARLDEQLLGIRQQSIMPPSANHPLPDGVTPVDLPTVTVTRADSGTALKSFFVPFNQLIRAAVTVRGHGSMLYSDVARVEVWGLVGAITGAMDARQAVGTSMGARLGLSASQVCVSLQRLTAVSEELSTEMFLNLQRGWYIAAASVNGGDNSLATIAITPQSYPGAPAAETPPPRVGREPLLGPMFFPMMFLAGAIALPFVVRGINGRPEWRDSRMEKRKVLIGSDACPPCVQAKRKYAKEIENGDLELLDINTMDSELLVKVADCLAESDLPIGLPVLAEIDENNKVCSCKLGV